MDDDRRAAILLHLARHGSPVRTKEIPSDLVLHGDYADLCQRLRPQTASRVISLRKTSAAEREQDHANRKRVFIAVPGDPTFPAELIGHPLGPPLLYIAGSLPDAPRIALIGARRCRAPMLRFANELGRSAGYHGVPVVSGLARGIDAAAHEGCLEARGAPIGVLGTGIDQIYPPEHQSLHERVAEHGALVTTFPLGFKPRTYAFPARNRLVAALSTIVCVVQASLRSGTMSTAAAALTANTEVVAVPGPQEDEDSKGTNRLIRDGARPILSAEDLLEPILGLGTVVTSIERAPSPETGVREDDPDPLLNALSNQSLTPEELAAATGQALDEVLERLVHFELEGRIARIPGRRYRRR